MTSLISHLFVMVLSRIAKGGDYQDICESLVRNICHYFMQLAYPLTKCTLLVFGQIQDVFNISKNCVSRSIVEDMQVCPRFKLKKCCCSLKFNNQLDSQLSIRLKKLFQPRGSTVARQHLDRQVSVELFEKQNSSSVLTPIRVYEFELSFLTTLDI